MSDLDKFDAPTMDTNWYLPAQICYLEQRIYHDTLQARVNEVLSALKK